MHRLGVAEDGDTFAVPAVSRVDRFALARRYGSLSRLLAPAPYAVGESLDVLLDTEEPAEADRRAVELFRRGEIARRWSSAPGDGSSLAKELGRLFASEHGRAPLVSPCAATYLSSDAAGAVRRVSAAYDAAGFLPTTDSGACPCHICNELAFVAHLLEATEGELRSGADRFFVSHLFSWAIIFTTALSVRSRHPVVSFAARSLDDLLFTHWLHCR